MKKILTILVIMTTANLAQALDWDACCGYIARNDPTASYNIQSDWDGPRITAWSSIVPKPTKEDLQAVEVAALEWRNNITSTKAADYDAWNDERVKAVLKLLVKEINKLRVKNGDPAYTPEQIKTALKAEL